MTSIRFVGLVGLALLIGTGCHGSHAVSLANAATEPVPTAANRSWWQGLSASERRAAVKASIDAYSTGYFSGEFHQYQWEIQLVGTSKAAAIFKHRRWPVFSKSLDTYAEQVSDYYKENPTIEAYLGAMVECLSDNPVPDCAWHPNAKR